MATRDALIEAGTQAVCDWDPDYDPADEDTRAAVGVVIDAVLAGLRIQVEALPDVVGGRWFMRPAVYRHDVLALLDGATDGSP